MNAVVRTLLYLIITVLVIFVFIQVTTSGNRLSESSDSDENKNDVDSGRIFIINDQKAVRLDDEVLRLSGIKSEQLESITYNPEFSANAEVVDIEPLITAKTEFLNLQAEQKVLLVDLNNQHKILERAEALYQTKSLTSRELEQIRADYELKVSRVNEKKTQMDNFSFQLKSEWGIVIGNLVLEPENESEFNKLASFKSSIILVSLLKNRTLTDIQQKVYIGKTYQRDKAILARYLDQARHISNPFFGESYYYYVDMVNPGAGLVINAWIEESGESVEGIFVPDQAVIWYANEPWIYTMHDKNLFVRIPISTARKVTSGWILDETLANGDPVVTSGGQSLLSEEFKWAIPDENAD